MSRIHEALKKAEMEVAILEPTGRSSVPKQAIADDPNGKIISQSLAQQVRPGPEIDLAPLKFDQLVKACSRFQWHLSANKSVFEAGSETGNSGEGFRSLRSKLDQIRSIQPFQTLLITSATPGEGKTFVLNNLAQAIVRQAGRHVLVIDADLRGSALHKVLGAPSGPGLAEYLRGEAEELGIIQIGNLGLGLKSTLCLIPAGEKVNNPTELLSNGRMKTLLNRVSPAFDWVIIDSPPCTNVADASILADITDGLLFVVRAGATPSASVEKARQELPKDKILGVLLNAVENRLGDKSEHYCSDHR